MNFKVGDLVCHDPSTCVDLSHSVMIDGKVEKIELTGIVTESWIDEDDKVSAIVDTPLGPRVFRGSRMKCLKHV